MCTGESFWALGIFSPLVFWCLLENLINFESSNVSKCGKDMYGNYFVSAEFKAYAVDGLDIFFCDSCCL